MMEMMRATAHRLATLIRQSRTEIVANSSIVELRRIAAATGLTSLLHALLVELPDIYIRCLS
jgi:hypothetical protein